MHKAFTARLLASLSFALLLVSCSDRETPSTPVPPSNPLEEVLEEGALSLEGVTEAGLNSSEPTLKFALKTSTFASNPAELKLTINGEPIDPALVQLTPNQILIPVKLTDGRNDIAFKAYDSVGRPLYMNKTVWAGSNQLVVTIVDSNGAPFSGSVDVKLKLSDAPEIADTLKVSGGQATFSNVPGRTVILEAQAPDNSSGTAGAFGGDGTVKLQVFQFNQPDPVDNNDFSQGLAGYVFGSSPVTLIPHTEEVGPAKLPPAAVQANVTSASRIVRHSAARQLMAAPVAATVAPAAAGDNMDASLSTLGEGPQRMSRTFTIKPGTSSVSVRYRFVTSEVPGGYFGSQYNDYFSVTIRSKSGAAIMESNTMNGLGLAAFDANGSTAWKTLKLQTATQGDEVQVDLTVANVSDDLLDSEIIVDLISEKDDVTPSLAWDPADGGLKLSYKVGKKQLENDVSIDVYWASGPDFASRIGAALTSVVVPAGTAAGTTGTRNIPGSQLHADPQGVTHLIAVVNEETVGPVPDVRIVHDANADPAAVSDAMRDAIKDGLRSAGTKQARISRTAVGPADQARAMFQNLTRSPGPLSANIAEQLSVYAGPGEAVVRVFEARTPGMTPSQAQANSAALQAAMVAEINAQGPSKVSKHCADPNTISVVDVRMTSFAANARPRFREVAAARSRLLQENGVYHMEIER
jgi:hypothetical protein